MFSRIQYVERSISGCIMNLEEAIEFIQSELKLGERMVITKTTFSLEENDDDIDVDMINQMYNN